MRTATGGGATARKSSVWVRVLLRWASSRKRVPNTISKQPARTIPHGPSRPNRKKKTACSRPDANPAPMTLPT